MERHNRKFKNTIALFWCIIYFLPIVLFLVILFNSTFRQDFNALTYLDDFINNFANNFAISSFSSLANNYLPRLLNIFTGVTVDNDYIIVVAGFVNWYVVFSLIHIVVDLILFLPNVVKHLLYKGGVSDVE